MANTPKKKPKSTGYNGWEFLRDFSNHVFGLLNSGRIITAFGVMILGIMAIVVLRMPEAELAPLVRGAVAFVNSSAGLMISLLFGSNAFWFWMNRRQKRIYEAEISRLAEIRSELLHLGGNLVKIKNHRSSSGEQQEGYLIPNLPSLQNGRNAP